MMVKLGLVSLFSTCVAFGIAASSGCSSVEHAYDCSQICNKYKDCANESYDVAACTQRCSDSAAKDKAFADKAEKCQKCVDEHSCLGATFACATECIGIVP
ncbi:MAG TPA: hypothetical protein VN253_20025 [Kofleriaceae bacterium]|nr:hypothetical protein [Kofleriaceae bacterium]